MSDRHFGKTERYAFGKVFGSADGAQAYTSHGREHGLTGKKSCYCDFPKHAPMTCAVPKFLFEIFRFFSILHLEPAYFDIL